MIQWLQAVLKALEAAVKPDGGIYRNGRIRSYETCVAIVGLKLANKDGEYYETLAIADKFARGLQFGAAGNEEEPEQWFGGVGYGGPERPDVSNTVYLVESLAELHSPSDDAAIQRALVFVGRCQNLKGAFNDTKFGPLVNDDGFYYAIPSASVDPSTSERYTDNGGYKAAGR